MKKKLLALALISVLALSVLGAACGSSEFSKTYEDSFGSKIAKELTANQKILNAVTDINLDAAAPNIDAYSQYRNLKVFTSTVDGYAVKTVYNTETNAVVGTFTNTDTVTYNGVNVNAMLLEDVFYDYFMVTKTTAGDPAVTEYFLYNADGSLAGSSNAKDGNTFTSLDVIFLGVDYYRINKDGKFEKAGTLTKAARNLVNTSLDNARLNDGRYYRLLTGGGVGYGEAFVYDSDFVLTRHYKVPSYAANANISVLDNGNLLIQYRYNVSSLDGDYTYFDGANHVKVCTLVLDVDNGKTEEVETTGVFNGTVYSRSTNYDGYGVKFINYDSSIKNYANVYYITDKRLDETLKLSVINNNGEIDRAINEVFNAQKAGSAPINISKDRFIITDSSNALYLIKSSGKVIANVTNCEYNAKFILIENKIYDHDFKELKAFDSEKWDVLGVMNNSIALRSKEDAKKFVIFNGADVEITLTENQTIGDTTRRYYVIKTHDDATGTDSYTYYNENGAAIYTSDVQLAYKGSFRNGKMLFTFTKDGKITNLVFASVELK